jgi:hypothetical protein
MVMFIKVPPAEEEDPAPELDIGAIHRKYLCHGEKIGRNLCRGRGRFCDADDELEFEQGEAFRSRDERWRRF